MMDTSKWWCESCRVTGAVSYDDTSREIWGVLQMIVKMHERLSPDCSVPVATSIRACV
jgi:hypothetical protein